MDLLEQEDIITELRQPNIEQSVKKLYKKYFETIVTNICVTGGNQDDGADIFQEAVLILIDKVKTGQFRGESSIKTFLSAIARNLWLHELRTRSRRNSREHLYVNQEDEADESTTPVWEDGQTDALEKVMNQIGDTCKKILIGVYYEDKSMKELLDEFNYENEQVLRNRKSRCMKKLRELISNDTNLFKKLKSFLIYEK
jgi:RNA polymerase sigma factor (sigma-70 family)